MKKVHFIGIGGIGTSALAQIYHSRGIEVTGSDQNPTALPGIKTFTGHKTEQITNQDLIIYSPAIPGDNPELLAAKNKGIKTLTYPQALGELSKEYFTIAVAGTHGKSTTTAMTAIILTDAGLDPTVVVGTKVPNFNNQNFRIGKSKYLVVEACEYKRSFTNLDPNILAITNTEPDHLDYFKDEADYLSAFSELESKSAKVIKEIPGDEKYKPGVIGGFNIQNATIAAKIASELKIPEDQIIKSLQNFKGTWRRMEEKPKIGSCRIIDDYAHHPTEIKATLGAIRKANPSARILAIFQPHQYSRTYELLDSFATSFHDANKVIIPNIYRVRDSESDIAKVSVDDLVSRIGEKAENGGGLEATREWLEENCGDFDIAVVMGAGDVGRVINIGEIKVHT